MSFIIPNELLSYSYTNNIINSIILNTCTWQKNMNTLNQGAYLDSINDGGVYVLCLMAYI